MSREHGTESRATIQSGGVSVIIPTRNRRSLLLVTLHSVLWQADVNFEVLVVDDGSSDGSSKAVRALGDPRIRVLYQSGPHGVSRARNRGAAEARGEWLAFVDDDDLWAPTKLVEQLAASRRTGADWVYAGTVNVNRELCVAGGAPPPTPASLVASLPRWNPMPGGCSNVIVRRRVFANVGGFDEGLSMFADWDLWRRLAVNSLPTAVYKPLLAYRMHEGGMMLNDQALRAEMREMERRAGRRIDRSRLYRHLSRLSLISGELRTALAYAGVAVATAATSPRSLVATLSDSVRMLSPDVVAALRRRLPLGLQDLMKRPGSDTRSFDPHARWKASAEWWIIRLREEPLRLGDRLAMEAET
jgi:glycosyltransferase involved in cell wall biosynthesis